MEKKVWADGGYYEGEFSRDKRHGWGELTWANGDIYDGDWQNDNRTGKGRLTFSSGDVYDGDWQSNKLEGKGRFTWSSGSYYEGGFVNNRRHGKGKWVYDDGSIYEGEFVEGRRHGKGKFTWSDGNVYEGDFINGDLTGYGKKYYADTGETKEGLWENGEYVRPSADSVFDKQVRWRKEKSLTGLGNSYQKGRFIPLDDNNLSSAYRKGRLVWSDGSFYEGEFFYNYRHGQGKLVSSDGLVVFSGRWSNNFLTSRTPDLKPFKNSEYHGEVANEQPHGKGLMIYADGSVHIGFWNQGRFRGDRGEPFLEKERQLVKEPPSTVKYTRMYGNGVYKGQFKDTKRHGQGRMDYSGTEWLSYEGEWQNDERTGQGTLIWRDGKCYTGALSAGIPHGQGKLIGKTGEVQEGIFYYGKFESESEKNKKTLTLATGLYKGEVLSGSPHGKGKLIYTNGSTYEGEFSLGHRHGYGKQAYANGKIYEGNWYGDKRHGTGKLTWSNGDIYEGEFSNDTLHGQGIMLIASTGRIKKGTWLDGSFRGELSSSSSSSEITTLKDVKTLNLGIGTYEGEVQSDLPHGKGKLVYTSGAIYEGDFSLGRRHGYGIYRNKENTLVQDGYWENNYFKTDKKAKQYAKPKSLATDTPKIYPDGKYIGDFVDGKRHGKGKFIFSDGSYWEGDWNDDIFTGKGRHIANHSQYEGQFLNGKYHGHGRKVYVDDSIYEGNWYQGIRHGKGRLTFRDGNYYEGGFSNNKRHGRGSIYNKFGTIIESGSWEYGKKISNRTEVKSPKQSSTAGTANVNILCPCGSGKQFKNCHGLRK